MVKICRESQSLRQHIACREIDSHRLSAGSGLVGAFLHLSYKCLIVLERKVGIEREVVAHPLLTPLHLEHGVEFGNLISGTHGDSSLTRLHKLPGSSVKRQGAPIAIFEVYRQIVFQRPLGRYAEKSDY